MQKNPARAVIHLNQKARPTKRLSLCTGLIEMTSDCLGHIRQGTDCLHPSSTHTATPHQNKRYRSWDLRGGSGGVKFGKNFYFSYMYLMQWGSSLSHPQFGFWGFSWFLTDSPLKENSIEIDIFQTKKLTRYLYSLLSYCSSKLL